jgi:hypothetical protein
MEDESRRMRAEAQAPAPANFQRTFPKDLGVFPHNVSLGFARG